MAFPARDNYLAAEVLTAPQQRLHLMLIDGAVRCMERARQCWRAGQPEAAVSAIIRAEEILGELLAGMNREVGGDLVRNAAAVYAFVFRTLMEANAAKDERKLDEALKVLAIERETWRQVCDQLAGSESNARPGADAVSLHPAETIRPPVARPLVTDIPSAEHFSGRFSIDA